jgi:indolepyruvate ferredoxin oxidoreductase alpha subunit
MLGTRRKAAATRGFQKDPERWVPIPLYARRMRVRVEERLGRLAAAVGNSIANRIEWGDRSLGIIAEGICYQYVREVAPEASVLKIGWVWPFPDELIREFAAGVRRLLVIEELDPILEEHVRSLGIACEGRSLVPGIGELSPDRLVFGSGEGGHERKPPTRGTAVAAGPSDGLPARPPVLCPSCPHRGIFYALGKFDVIVTGDIGCYALGVFPPLKRIDTILCMGGGISMAHGMQKAIEHRASSVSDGKEGPSGDARKIVGMVGDSTFFHRNSPMGRRGAGAERARGLMGMCPDGAMTWA